MHTDSTSWTIIYYVMFPDGFAHLLPNAAVWHGQENGSLFVWFFYLHFLLKSRTGKGNDFWMCDKQIENETRCEDVVLSTCRSWHVAFLVFFFFFLDHKNRAIFESSANCIEKKKELVEAHACARRSKKNRHNSLFNLFEMFDGTSFFCVCVVRVCIKSKIVPSQSKSSKTQTHKKEKKIWNKVFHYIHRNLHIHVCPVTEEKEEKKAARHDRHVCVAWKR